MKAIPPTAHETKDISFFVPCYNEENNIIPTLDTIRMAMASRPWSSEILVYDDGSTDHTSQQVQAYQSSHPDMNIRLFTNDINRGLGTNYLRGAIEAQGAHYLMVCGDNDTPPATLEALLNQLGKADMVVHYIGNMEERPWIRRLLSMAFTSLVRKISGSSLRYYNGMVLHRTETVRRFQPHTAGFAYQAEILCQALAHGISFIEVPLRTVPQKGSFRTSAFRLTNIISVASSLWRIFRDPKYHCRT